MTISHIIRHPPYLLRSTTFLQEKTMGEKFFTPSFLGIFIFRVNDNIRFRKEKEIVSGTVRLADRLDKLSIYFRKIENTNAAGILRRMDIGYGKGKNQTQAHDGRRQ